MNIMEYADVLNLEISLTYYPNQDGRWCARFERGEIMEGGCLVGAHGNGQSPTLAIVDYVEQIKGKKMAFNSMSDRRSEFEIPKTLTSGAF